MVSKSLASRVDGTTSTLASFAYAIPYYAIGLIGYALLGIPLGDLSARFWFFVFLRSLTDACAEWLKMSALAKTDISLVAPFFTLSPVLLLFLGPLISDDQLTPLGISGVLLSVLGSIGLLPRRSANVAGSRSSAKQGILMAIGASMFFALNTLFDRLAVKSASSLVSAAAMTAAATIPFIIPVFRSSKRRKIFFKEAKLFHLRGIFEVGFMTLRLFALSALPGAYVSGLKRISVLGSIIGGRMIFQEQEAKRRFLCGLLVCIGSVLIVFSG
jgi:drug/metabolite transporter (DMT)-like permease